MGVVYEAQDTRLPRSVAIKVLKDELARNVEAVRRFKREARLASSLNHPNICTILDVSESGPHAFIAMEFLEGESLKARLKRGRPSQAETVAIIRQVADALSAAHSRGIMHRDITPGNIFLTTGGLVKLLDFGLATQFSSSPDDEDTTDDVSVGESVAGTIHYMAPEQFTDTAVPDVRSDLYSLGVVFYEMTTGVKPFAHESRRSVIDAITYQPHVPMRQLTSQHSTRIGAMIDRLLAKSPGQRYQSADSFCADLELVAANSPSPTSTRARGDEAHASAPVGGYTTVPEAYHAFKRGKRFWESCHAGGWEPALSEFQDAVVRDPQFARAHVAIANAYNFIGFYSIDKPGAAFAAAAEAAGRAICLNDRLGRAFIELALAKLGGEWDWEGAEAAFRRGLAVDPSDAMAHVHYAWLLVLLGRKDAAFVEADRGVALAPSSRLVAAGRAQTLFLAGEYERAIDACDECLRFDRDYVFAIHVRGLSYLAKGMRAAAIPDLERAAQLGGRSPFYLGLLGRCYAEDRRREDALAILDELARFPPSVYVPPQCYVFVYAALGDRGRALESQEMAYRDGASPFNYLVPGIRELYARSPDHKRRLEQMRLIL
jgi:tetratricopeptide (TPR) repeat protein/tRNA A-37 threonylcarbamoyl transferase component Bud32